MAQFVGCPACHLVSCLSSFLSFGKVYLDCLNLWVTISPAGEGSRTPFCLRRRVGDEGYPKGCSIRWQGEGSKTLTPGPSPSGRGEQDCLLPAQEITGNRFKIDGGTPGIAMPPTAGLRQNADFMKRASDFPAVPRPLPGGFRCARLRSHSTRKATTGRVGCQPVPRPGAWTIYTSQAAPFTPAPATSSPYSSRLPLYRSLKNS